MLHVILQISLSGENNLLDFPWFQDANIGSSDVNTCGLDDWFDCLLGENDQVLFKLYSPSKKQQVKHKNRNKS